MDDTRPDELRDQRDEDAAVDAAEDAVEWSSWANLWQMPAIIIGIALIGLGVYVAMQRAPENDFEGALAQIDQLIASSQFDLASEQLGNTIEPNLDQASVEQRGQFHALVADWIAAWQQQETVNDPQNNERIDENYAKAVDFGITLSPLRIERWANALIDLGRIESAQLRLHELDARQIRDSDPGIQDRRNRVLRRLVAHTLRSENLQFEDMMRMLSEYRSDQVLTAADEAWAVARLAELRLEADRPQEAIDRLLVDMRRVESRSATDQPVNFAELYMLLARSYYMLGDYDNSQYHLDRAMTLLDGTDPIRGDVLVLCGRINTHRDELDTAFGDFDLAVREFPATRSFLPAMLGRAEIRSVLGDHAGSLADYERLASLVTEGTPRRDVTPMRVARSLCDRHDAVLATGRLQLAIDYVALAERLFDPADVPIDVLLRLASTNRQHAENLLAEARERVDGRGPRIADIDPRIRHEANVHFQRAGDDYVRHARAVMALPTQDESWADSLWRAADSYDVGGRPDRAIDHFNEYLEGRPSGDPRRAEVTFRLAQALQAERRFDEAGQQYESVISVYPRSPFASASHVPLSQCLCELDRPNDARQVLQHILAGNRILGPESMDFRDALVALGIMLHDLGEYTEAIERLDQAVQRYPEDPRFNEILYRLADSFRGSAEAIGRRLTVDPSPPPPRERRRLVDLRRAHLETAAALFDDVSERYGALDQSHLDSVQREFQRNTHLLRGLCAFELGRFENAIELYDFAARVHSEHLSSLSALIQIVNCYAELEDWESAAAAHERARVRLQQLPDEAFDDPSLLMDRASWERWLENEPIGPVPTERALSTATTGENRQP